MQSIVEPDCALFIWNENNKLPQIILNIFENKVVCE